MESINGWIIPTDTLIANFNDTVASLRPRNKNEGEDDLPPEVIDKGEQEKTKARANSNLQDIAVSTILQ